MSRTDSKAPKAHKKAGKTDTSVQRRNPIEPAAHHPRITHAHPPSPQQDLPFHLRVLQVLPELETGGTEQSALDFAVYLKSQKIINFISSKGGSKVEVLQKNGIPHFTLPLHRKSPWAIWRNSRQLVKIIDEYGINLIHARSRAPAWAAWLAHLARPHTRYITTFHGTYGAGNALKRAYNRVMLKGPYTIANSHFIKQHIVQTYGYPAQNIIVAQRGADPAIFDPARFNAESRQKLRQKFNLPKGVPLLTLVGRLRAWKGQKYFLEALSGMQSLPWHALIVGGPTSGPFYQELQQFVQQNNLQDRVTFTGDQPDVARFYDISDICFTCSLKPEAFGRIAVEAQMMGKPVIATNLGGSRESVQNGQTGWLVAPNSPQALRQCLAAALTDPKALASMGKRARQAMLAGFTTQACCEGEFAAYKKLI